SSRSWSPKASPSPPSPPANPKLPHSLTASGRLLSWAAMRLTRLKLKDFRGFESLDLELDEKLTVLVGKNGSGKSTVLDAIAVGVQSLAGVIARQGFVTPKSRDIRGDKPEATIGLDWDDGYEYALHCQRDRAVRTNSGPDVHRRPIPRCVLFTT